jgi:hypothetical protein
LEDKPHDGLGIQARSSSIQGYIEGTYRREEKRREEKRREEKK